MVTTRLAVLRAERSPRAGRVNEVRRMARIRLLVSATDCSRQLRSGRVRGLGDRHGRPFLDRRHPVRDLPAWALGALNDLPSYLTSVDAKMAAVIEFARRNVRERSGGPFASASSSGTQGASS